MNLILKIIDSHNFDPSGQNIKEFYQKGGSIGRQDGNDFILIDQEKSVSKLHAFIHYRNGQYYLTDVSRNGVFFNEEDIPIAQSVDNPRIIREGDQIRMGYFLLQANLEEDAANIVRELDTHEDRDELEKLLAGDEEAIFLPKQHLKTSEFNGRFGGLELHEDLGIENTTREAKHVAGDLNIDDFLNQDQELSALPHDDISDLLDLDKFADDKELLAELTPPKQSTLNTQTKTERLAELAVLLTKTQDSFERDAILAEIRRLSE